MRVGTPNDATVTPLQLRRVPLPSRLALACPPPSIRIPRADLEAVTLELSVDSKPQATFGAKSLAPAQAQVIVDGLDTELQTMKQERWFRWFPGRTTSAHRRLEDASDAESDLIGQAIQRAQARLEHTTVDQLESIDQDNRAIERQLIAHADSVCDAARGLALSYQAAEEQVRLLRRLATYFDVDYRPALLQHYAEFTAVRDGFKAWETSIEKFLAYRQKWPILPQALPPRWVESTVLDRHTNQSFKPQELHESLAEPSFHLPPLPTLQEPIVPRAAQRPNISSLRALLAQTTRVDFGNPPQSRNMSIDDLAQAIEAIDEQLRPLSKQERKQASGRKKLGWRARRQLSTQRRILIKARHTLARRIFTQTSQVLQSFAKDVNVYIAATKTHRAGWLEAAACLNQQAERLDRLEAGLHGAEKGLNLFLQTLLQKGERLAEIDLIIAGRKNEFMKKAAAWDVWNLLTLQTQEQARQKDDTTQ